jgi:outer membrane lipoprotein-sorting protein
MRRISRVCFVLFALTGSIAALAAQGQPSLDDVIAKNIKAKGGAEKLKSVQSTRITGTMTVQGQDLGMTVTTKRPNLVRQEITVQDNTIVQAYDGSTAWTINPMTGSAAPQEITGPPAQALKEQADFEPVFLDYKAKGTNVELIGSEQVDGKNATHLKVTKKTGLVQHYFLDPDTGLEMRVTTTLPGPEGQQGTLTNDLSNYKEVEGMTVPFTLKQTIHGGPMGDAQVQLAVSKVEFNVASDDSIFKMPKK